MKKHIEKLNKKRISLMAEFKTFISKGNVLDLAVATIIGSAFGAIVTSFTNGIIMPLISLCLGKEDLSKLVVVLREANEAEGITALTWQYGTFLQAIINFFIIAIFLFVLIKIIANVRKAIDINANMTKVVQKKLDNDEPLSDFEASWLKRYTKKNPALAPKKAEPVAEEQPKEPELTTTEKLLTEILTTLKETQGEKSENK